MHRIFDDGRVPDDNPFVGKAGALATIWSYGHRNPQGLAKDPATGLLYDAEHGPRGGDELNLVQKGRNYGWPVITYGMNYDGTPMTDLTAKEGMEQPVTYWVPSIAVSSIAFYKGAKFPKWDGQLFLGALAQEELRRLVLADGKVTHQEVLFKNVGRVRDVVSGPDGYIYVTFDGGRVARLVPAPGEPATAQSLSSHRSRRHGAHGALGKSDLKACALSVHVSVAIDAQLPRSPLNGRVRGRLPRPLVYLPVACPCPARRRADGRVGCRRAGCRRVRDDRAAVSRGHLPAVSQRPPQARRVEPRGVPVGGLGRARPEPLGAGARQDPQRRDAAGRRPATRTPTRWPPSRAGSTSNSIAWTGRRRPTRAGSRSAG